jgi:hypothetical protein
MKMIDLIRESAIEIIGNKVYSVSLEGLYNRVKHTSDKYNINYPSWDFFVEAVNMLCFDTFSEYHLMKTEKSIFINGKFEKQSCQFDVILPKEY